MLSVLLVCTGNICRSPLAEGFLVERSERLFDGAIRVRSAGTWARRASPPMTESIQAAAERGVDISAATSSPLVADMVGDADLVLTMTAEQRDEVLGLAPDARDRTFTLKEAVALFAAMPPAPTNEHSALSSRIADAARLRETGSVVVDDEDVSDPLGMSIDTYRAVAWEIESLIDALVGGLFGAERREETAEAKKVWG